MYQTAKHNDGDPFPVNPSNFLALWHFNYSPCVCMGFVWVLDSSQLPKHTCMQICEIGPILYVNAVYVCECECMQPCMDWVFPVLLIHQFLKIIFCFLLISSGPAVLHLTNTNITLRFYICLPESRGITDVRSKEEITRFAALRDLRSCRRSYLKFNQQDRRRKKRNTEPKLN